MKWTVNDEKRFIKGLGKFRKHNPSSPEEMLSTYMSYIDQRKWDFDSAGVGKIRECANREMERRRNEARRLQAGRYVPEK